MGIYSTGEYGIPEGIMYSYPLEIKNKEWSIVKDLPISDFARKKMDDTAKELVEERAMAEQILASA
jgi:malate dehydrogenase